VHAARFLTFAGFCPIKYTIGVSPFVSNPAKAVFRSTRDLADASFAGAGLDEFINVNSINEEPSCAMFRLENPVFRFHEWGSAAWGSPNSTATRCLMLKLRKFSTRRWIAA
jgi:hypothetical protein